MAVIPKTMRSLVAPKYCGPSQYEVIELPVPVIEQPDEVLIKVQAASLMTGDTQTAKGAFRLFTSLDLPLKLGVEGSGIVVAVGDSVKTFKVGDAVYGLDFRHPILPLKPTGFCSEYTVVREGLLLSKPPTLSFEEAASLVGPTITAYQCIRDALKLTENPTSSLEGKTVFMPAALSCTGSIGAQVIKNVYGAKKLISTVSTPKIPLVEQHLPGIVDKVIDYKTQNVVKEVGKGAVDFVYNTQWDLTGTFPLVKKGGAIGSIASIPGPDVAQSMLANAAPFWLVWVLSLAQAYYRWRLRGTDVKQLFVSGNPSRREDLEKAGEIINAGKVKAVMTVVDLNDLRAVRQACDKVATGKGGIGRLVIKIV